MIPNHPRFIEAISEKRKVRVRFYSKADDGVLDRVCAPMDYGPGGGNADELNRYWLWDYAGNTGPRTLDLLPQQVMDLQMLGEVFDPAEFGARPWPWSISRDWGSSSQSVEPSRPLPSPPEPLAGRHDGATMHPPTTK